MLSAGVLAQAPGQRQSLHMPLADKSLLLDVTCTGQRLIAVGERGHILLSDDQGESWRQVVTPTRQMLTAVSFPTPARGWAVGHDGLILASIDAGESWSVQRDGLLAQRAINKRRLVALQKKQVLLREQLTAASVAAEREDLRSAREDAALDIEDLELSLAGPAYAPPLLDIAFVDELHGIAVGAFNSLVITRDGGANWSDTGERLDNPLELHLNSIVGDGAGKWWLAGEGGLLFRSVDGAVSWQALPSPSQASWFGIARESRQQSLLVFGLRGNIYRSLDDGSSWQAAVSSSERSLNGGTFLSDRYALLVGAVGSMLLSEDGGASFTEHPLAQRVNLSAVSASCGPILVVGQGGTYRHVSLDQIR